jgi:LAO/AO transport system kinase
VRRRRPGLGAAAAGLSERPLNASILSTGALGTGDIAAAVQAGDKRALARVISWVENGDPRARSVLRDMKPPPGGSRVIGLTGAPGAGKSTVTSALVRAFRARVGPGGERSRVAVLAVDPSSPFTGGALLGDRIRMQEHATDDGVFIRSMGSRGQLGGLAAATPQAIRVLGAAGYQVILVETVGVGQAEVEIASAADSTVVLVVPGMGDSIQAAKAGLLEVADVLVVNKADRPDTQATLRDLRYMVSLATGEWKPPIVPTVGTTGDGVDELVERLDQHDAWLESSGERARRRLARARDEVTALALGALARRIAVADELAARVAEGRCDPVEAAEELLDSTVIFKGLLPAGGRPPARKVSGVSRELGLPFDPIDRAARIWERRFGPSSAMAAVISIMRAQQLLLGELDAILRPYGLTFARYEALVLLSFSREGALPLRVMGERLMVHPTSVTNTIDRLEDQGMVVRRPNPADGRGRLAEITERGRDAVQAATRDLMAAEFGLPGYSEPDRAALFTLLRELRLSAGDFTEP